MPLYNPLTADAVTSVPAGNLAAADVQAALNELDSEKGGLALANAWTNTNTFSHATGVTTDTITERTAAAGVTIDGTLLKDNTLSWAGDTNLYRLEANALATDDRFDSIRTNATDLAFAAYTSAAAFAQHIVLANGIHEWGDGTNARDTVLYRAAANTLATDDRFCPADDGLTAQTACGLFAGSGAPSNSNGSDGDIYFRSDGGAGTTIYHKRVGAWVGVV